MLDARPGSDRRAPGRAPAGPGWVRGAVALGLLLLVGPPLGWAALRTPALVGVAPGGDARAAPVLGGPGSSLPPGTAVTAIAGPVDASRWPVSLSLPGLAVTLPVEPVGLDADGDVAVPASPARVGWDRRAAVPGGPGVAVLAAHVDSRVEGLGPFARLVELGPGDDVIVTDAAGRRSRWVVTGRAMTPKDALGSGWRASPAGSPRLALVTCGGAFDPVARSYAENVVVWAVPSDGPRGASRS